MPEAAEAHRRHQIDVAPRRALPVPAKRDVEVVAQPARKGHVPATPEVAGVHRAVWTVEVPGQFDAEHAREPQSHVGEALKSK